MARGGTRGSTGDRGGDDLFAAPRGRPPLAARARPTSIEDVVGQGAAIGPDTPVGRRLRSGRIGSVVLWGPPGTGKTTLARAVGATGSASFRALHPADSGVAELRALAAEARRTPTLAFVDEGHRMGTPFWDMALGFLEEGAFDLVVATTGNPHHVLPAALVSRSALARIEALTPRDVELVVARGLDVLRREGTPLTLGRAQVRSIAERSNGDGRRALGVVEDLARLADGEGGVADADVAACLAGSPLASDRDGDSHYDLASALQKSMRNTDPDAAMYWLARMIHAGEDARWIARRVMVAASEDVGLADGTALATATAAHAAVCSIGYPEARVVLAHAVLHVTLAPKSNSANRAIGLALAKVAGEAAIAVPPQLRDAHYAGAASLGHVGYRSPHETAAGWIGDLDHRPGIEEGSLYQSDERGPATYEARANAHREALIGRPVTRRRARGDG